MFCYQCGAQLSEHDFCTACGADVGLYKKIMYVSNRFYNDGLEKAGVRDLSGAVTSLRQSLKFNKDNVEARNLLGLVYFEMGEVVAAMSEWIISQNLRPEKNLANDYVNDLQESANRLDTLNQTIKKYNQAYTYCVQGSKDLAVLQLKKVLSLNPKFVRAHQLLALLYMDAEQWEKAERELRRCLDIDCGGTMTLRYLQETERMLQPDDNMRQSPRRKREDTVRYQSDNEIIIQPVNGKSVGRIGAASTLLNLAIGLVIGLAACYFLVVPAKVTNARNEMQETITTISSQSDAKTATIQELEAEIETLQNEKDAVDAELEGYVGEDGTLDTIDDLLNAASAYLETVNTETADLQTTAASLETIAANVNIEETSEAFQRLYNDILGIIGPELATTYYSEGYTAYRNRDYTTAIELLTKAVYYDATDVDALYNLANAYRGAEDTESALANYQKVVEFFPDTARAADAQRYIDEMTAAE